ncbi:hypothetical protein [Micromonospora sp. DPT]|uniref:hypothetical protein n=1 Tax=Micromonospora sp. DPT TaxID=3142975 RepID=UPI00320A6BBE
MDNHRGHVAAAGDRSHVQRRDDQSGVMTLTHRIPEDPPAAQIDRGGQVELAAMSPHQGTSGAGAVNTRLANANRQPAGHRDR